MNKTFRNIILILLVIGIIGLVTGYFMWNKPHLDVAKADATAVEAAALYASFSKDSASAKKQYHEKVLVVSGKVHGSIYNQQQQQVITLETGIPEAFVNCTMEKAAGTVSAGSNITIRGICSGMGQGDPDMGIMGDLYMTRCISSDTK
jgi:hypothetical protein